MYFRTRAKENAAIFEKGRILESSEVIDLLIYNRAVI